jgi:hypothetical protein
VHHCLKKRASARFQTAHDLAFSLESALRSLGDTAPTAAHGWRDRTSALLRGRLAALFACV